MHKSASPRVCNTLAKHNAQKSVYTFPFEARNGSTEFMHCDWPTSCELLEAHYCETPVLHINNMTLNDTYTLFTQNYQIQNAKIVAKLKCWLIWHLIFIFSESIIYFNVQEQWGRSVFQRRMLKGGAFVVVGRSMQYVSKSAVIRRPPHAEDSCGT
jgi:hypothetical protein